MAFLAGCQASRENSELMENSNQAQSQEDKGSKELKVSGDDYKLTLETISKAAAMNLDELWNREGRLAMCEVEVARDENQTPGSATSIKFRRNGLAGSIVSILDPIEVQKMDALLEKHRVGIERHESLRKNRPVRFPWGNRHFVVECQKSEKSCVIVSKFFGRPAQVLTDEGKVEGGLCR